MLRALTLVAALTLPAPAPADVAITSIADWPCAEWQARRASGRGADAPQMWLAGFLTGMASALGVDALAITNAERVFGSMDAWCEANPDGALSAGGIHLFNELVRALPRGPKQGA